MADLFPEINRTRVDALRRGEKQFDFYNSCARPGYDAFRSIVNGWLAKVAESEKAELVARMSKGGDRAFQSGMIELIVHSYLSSLNQRVVLHPDIQGVNSRPDFAVLNDDDSVAVYVEVTTVNPAAEDDGKANREALIYNAIDAVKLPDHCVLGYEVIRPGAASPSLKSLLKEIAGWAESSVKKDGTKFTRRFKAGDWEVELDLFAGCSTKNFEHSIGIANGGVGWVTPNADLRSALEIKGKKYGKLKAPYLIAIADAKGQLFGAESTKIAISEAVLGDEIVQWSQGQTPRVGRAKNGFWHGQNGPKNSHVSGVMLFPDVGLWGLRSEKLQPVLAINPWAHASLPDTLKSAGHFEAENDEWHFKTGKNIADILKLPNPWPPEE